MKMSRVDEIQNLFRDAGAVVCVNEPGELARVEIRFSQLKDAQRLHGAIVEARATAPTESRRFEVKLLNFADDERILFCASCLLEAMNHNLVISSCALPIDIVTESSERCEDERTGKAIEPYQFKPHSDSPNCVYPINELDFCDHTREWQGHVPRSFRCVICGHFSTVDIHEEGECQVRGQSGFICGCKCVFPATEQAGEQWPTEEEAEAILRAHDTSGKEAVNGFIERLLNERQQFKDDAETHLRIADELSKARDVIDADRRAWYENYLAIRQAVKTFIRERGHHEGEHVFDLTVCRLCDESYVKAEVALDAMVEYATPAPSVAQPEAEAVDELAKLRQAMGWICDACDAAYNEDPNNERVHELFNIAAKACGLTRRLPDEYVKFPE
jgi:hypothetical protein